MDRLDKIRRMLEAFYEGNSSIQEEQELQEYFSSEELASEFEEDRILFESIASVKDEVELPDGLEGRLSEAINTYEEKERKIRRINMYSLSGLAAGLLVILSVYLGFIREEKHVNLDQFAIEDPELAYQEATKALALISEKWNAGTKELQGLNKVNEAIETIEPIRKVSSGSKELRLLGNIEKAKNL